MKECGSVWNETGFVFSEKEGRAWFAAFVIAFIVVFLLNAFTLAIYTRNRHLRKTSTYLIINLTVADLLIGTVTGASLPVFKADLESGNLTIKPVQAFNWQSFVHLTLQGSFVVASLANISLISLERLHATVFPFRHCLVGTRVYLAIILCSWLFSLILSSVLAILYLHESPALLYVYTSYCFLIIFILTVSYAIIISTVKNNPPFPNAQPVLSTERKLTVTLFIVTVASILTILPWVIWNVIGHHIAGNKLCPEVLSHIHYSFYLLYLFNSIVNPLIYAVRMQEFRKAARKLFLLRH